jgi:hypothetical protein
MNNRMQMTTVIVLLFVFLASIGVGYSLWSKTLEVEGSVNTGNVNAVFARDPFTDDDDKVNDIGLDSMDTGDCEISVREAGSCDPASPGPDPKVHYGKDVGLCRASLTANDAGLVRLINGYPSYHCTAWFKVKNTGNIPVKVASIKVNGEPVMPGALAVLDLTGDEAPDLGLQITDIKTCQQIDPGEDALLNIDQHVLQTALQGQHDLEYNVEVQLNQWNEGCGRVLFYIGNGGYDSYGQLKSVMEGLGYEVDYTTAWPADLGVYKLILILGPGYQGDGGANFFSPAQLAALMSYLGDGGRVVVTGDHSGLFGINTVNNLLSNLGVGIAQNADAATSDNDACLPMSDITPDQVTTPPLLSDGTARLDPSATSSLSLSGAAVSLARVDPGACPGSETPGATWMAIDRSVGPGGVVVIGDFNLFDDFSFSDPAHDGYSGAAFGANLVGY